MAGRRLLPGSQGRGRPARHDERRAAEFTRSYFAAYQAPPLQAPVELARHLVFGAVAYARSLGFEPAPGFQATAGHLGPWTGPSAIGFGRHGKPFFVQGPHDNARSHPHHAGALRRADNFHFVARA
jgi:hypothetical protein